MGLLNESFKADIQRELPPFAQPRAMAYITKFAPTISRMMINKPMAACLIPYSLIRTYVTGMHVHMRCTCMTCLP